MSTPNMNLNVPTVGVTTGSQYATDINGCMTQIDQHDHTNGNGVLITPAAININTTLPYANNRATLLKSLTFTAQNSPLSAVLPDLLAIYASGNDLYYNDGAGNQVRITQSGGIAGTPGSIANLTSPASASYVSASQTFVWQSDANTPANMDNGSVILRNITASSKGLTLNPPNAMAADYSLTLPTVPSSARVLVEDTAGVISPSAVSGTGTTQADVLPGFGLIPSGAMLPFGGTSAPAGYLLCDGTSYLRATYPSLFTAIGTSYGSVDASGAALHFNVPDARGMFLRGVSGTTSNDPDKNTRTVPTGSSNASNAVGSTQSFATQSHTHPMTVWTSWTFAGVNLSGSGDVSAPQGQSTGFNTGNTSTETRPLNVYVQYIIKI